MPLPILAIAGFAASAAMASSIAALHAGRAVVPQVGDWGDVVPRPVIDLDTMFGVGHLQDAVDHAVRRLEDRTILRWRAPVVGRRPDGPHDGEILISVGHALVGSIVASAAMEAEIDPGETADPDDSHELWSDDRRILRARIVLDPLRCESRDLTRIVAHELVHTMGYEHVTARLGRKHAEHRHTALKIPKSGHLMHPLYVDGGWGLQGLPE